MPLAAGDQWKEINVAARHWETLLFATTKGYYGAVVFLFGAAGAAIAWTTVPQSLQKWAVSYFLGAACVLSVLGLVTLLSQQTYLSGFYKKRKVLEDADPDLQLRVRVKGSGLTVLALEIGFGLAAALSAALIVLLPFFDQRPLLRGARLTGADLSTVIGLSQRDLEGACGDATTRLPHGLSVLPCK